MVRGAARRISVSRRGLSGALARQAMPWHPLTIAAMPTVLRVGPYRLFFFSADRDEPRHVHVNGMLIAPNSGLILCGWPSAEALGVLRLDVWKG